MKKGYFFMLDSFIAMSIIIFSLILIFSFHTSKPYQMQGIFIADDVMEYLTGTRVEELDNDFVISLYTGGATNITDTQNTLLEQTAEFYLTDQTTLAQNFFKNITKNLVPNKYGFAFRVYNETKTVGMVVNNGYVGEDEAKLIVTSRKVITGNINRSDYWGPMTAEARVWQ